ncbi:MAG: hypothetical protein CMF74_13155 [Maricaulis sp.]|jgi:UDP-N-acetylglucosamine:LPS N-acetylglucosamine transferase|nr:hypothetical protein [Maricaulis sp.]HAQ36815.1 hypothetical protein [Alphaproteobacteria bacterium]
MPLKTVDEALTRLRDIPVSADDTRLRARVHARLDQTTRAPALLLSGGMDGASVTMRVAPAALALVVGGLVAVTQQPRPAANELDVFSVRSPYSLAAMTEAPGGDT